ncbi:GDSL-type esterase/lipase family protein [Viscerimonas tarda]
MKKTFILFVFAFCLMASVNAKVIRITCVGNSITEGAKLKNPKEESYPAQLQALLGKNYIVSNFGVSGRTMLRKGNLPYWEVARYQDALNSAPDIVFISLGTNDAKAINRAHYDELVGDTRDMIRSFTSLSSHPRVVVILPYVSFEPDEKQIYDPIIVKDIIPRLSQAAYEEGVETIDMHPLLIDRRDLLPDYVHPNKEGAGVVAQRLYQQVTLKQDKKYDILKKFKQPVQLSEFKAYVCADFKWEGKNCKVVKPKVAAKNKPWIWRARFWAHEPQTDIALLERGYHLVYCDVNGLVGNDEAIRIWNSFHKMLTSAGLSKKCILEGMSRGAMYAFNWAAANPGKVAGVYVDNPLLDCRYFADGRPDDKLTQDIIKSYNLDGLEGVRNSHISPMDKIKEIAKGRYPILILCADQDEAVSPTQTFSFEEKIKAAGGSITVMVKKGFKHHPHSFPNPTPIVDFITQNCYKK